MVAVAVREVRRILLCLSVFALCSPLASAQDPISARNGISNKRLDLELPRERKQRRVVKELLGRDRWRRLNQARFWIAVHDDSLTPMLADDRFMYEEVSGILLRTVGRISHKAVLKRLRLVERRDALRERLGDNPNAESRTGGRPKLRVSPRLRYDDSAWLGAKLRLKGTDSRFWSSASLRVGSEFDGSNPGVKLGFEEDSRRAFLVYHGDHRKRGESLELLVSFSF